MKHTPGPWRDGPYGGIVADGDTGRDDPRNVAGYGGHLVCESVSSRNRPLLKAAPDMYESLRALVTLHIEECPNGSRCGAVRVALKALDRANGVTP